MRRRFARLNRQKQKDWAKYGQWVRKQLRIPKGQPLNLTPEQQDYYYTNPPVTNKRYPWRWLYDNSGVYTPGSSPAAMYGMSVEAADENTVDAFNYGKHLHDHGWQTAQGVARALNV